MFDDLLLFVRMVKYGSFTKAAKELGIYQSTLSRRIKNLEEVLKVDLIKRDATIFELTDKGKDFYEKFKDQETILNNLIHEAMNNAEINGELKVLLPPALSIKLITPELPKFLADNPDLRLKVYYQNHEFNMKKDVFDVAVVLGTPSQQSQKVKLIYRTKAVAFCTPGYVAKYGLMTKLGEGSKHKFVGALRDDGEILNKINIYNDKTGEIIEINSKNAIVNNSFVHTLELVNSNEYIALGFETNIKDELLSGKYIRVLPEYYFSSFDFYLLKRVSNDYRINFFAEFIEKCFKNA